MRKFISLFFILLIAAALPGRVMAMPITPVEFGAVFQIFNPATSTVQYAYDDVTDTFSMNGNIGSGAQGAVLNEYPFGAAPVANDIVSIFSLTAIVDDTGTFFGGSYSMIGSSASLGIAAGTTILSGTLTSVLYTEGGLLPDFQIMSTVDMIDASIVAAFGTIDSLLIDCLVCPAPFGFDWDIGFDPQNPSTQSPEIYGGRMAVAEPGMLMLLGIGIVCLGFARRRQFN